MTERISDDVAHRMLGQVIGVSTSSITWTPEALADLERGRRKFEFWSRWHPLASRRAKYRAALAVLEGIERGIGVSSFYEWALKMGRRHGEKK